MQRNLIRCIPISGDTEWGKPAVLFSPPSPQEQHEPSREYLNSPDLRLFVHLAAKEEADAKDTQAVV
jgi:hypothetical protein